MPTKTTKKKSYRAAQQKRTQRSAATTTRTHHRPEPIEIVNGNVAVYGVYPTRTQTRSGVDALKHAGFRNMDIHASSIEPVKVAPHTSRDTYSEIEESLVGTSARITGSLLGIGTLALAAPVMIALGSGLDNVFGGIFRRRGTFAQAQPEDAGILVTVHCDSLDRAKRATKAMESTGARDVAFSTHAGSPDNDLNLREYRDEEGNIRRHTRSYMRDHAQPQSNVPPGEPVA